MSDSLTKGPFDDTQQTVPVNQGVRLGPPERQMVRKERARRMICEGRGLLDGAVRRGIPGANAILGL